MEKIDLQILGTKSFIEKLKKDIKDNLKNGMSEEDSVLEALPETFPKDIKEAITNIVIEYVKINKA